MAAGLIITELKVLLIIFQMRLCSGVVYKFRCRFSCRTVSRMSSSTSREETCYVIIVEDFKDAVCLKEYWEMMVLGFTITQVNGKAVPSLSLVYYMILY